MYSNVLGNSGLSCLYLYCPENLKKANGNGVIH